LTARLDKTLKRELDVGGRTYMVAVSPDGIKLTLKGKRKGQELRWADLVSGDAALAVALNASVGSFAEAKAGPVARAPPAPGRRGAKTKQATMKARR
jgi:hypothetical protein